MREIVIKKRSTIIKAGKPLVYKKYLIFISLPNICIIYKLHGTNLCNF